MRGFLLAAVAALVMFSTSYADGVKTTWGDGNPPVTSKTDAAAKAEVGVAGGDVGRPVGKLTWRQRRALGLTPRGIASIVRDMNKEGEIEGKDNAVLSAEIASRLVKSNPNGYAEANLDWNNVIQFIEAILPLILKLIALFS